jgi:hypothetical protein
MHCHFTKVTGGHYGHGLLPTLVYLSLQLPHDMWQISSKHFFLGRTRQHPTVARSKNLFLRLSGVSELSCHLQHTSFHDVIHRFLKGTIGFLDN